ncbi:DNA methylase [Dysgonomonas capnocytophagoides]|uniref:DNA methylase n=1 Tax=Dysgonomonas capnocytophagoides TaxID=45254 RepID=UPI003991E325
MSDLYKQSETVVIKRSQINFAPYNPKNHTKEQINEIKKNIKRVAFLGGIVWNVITGNLIDGHKRVMALDVLNKYDGTPDTDYEVKVEKIELDLKTEKEQNIFQTQSRTQFDLDSLSTMIPDIDYKNAGLTDEDLQLIGIDFTFQTETEQSITDEINNLIVPVQNQKEAVKQAKKELSQAEKIAHNKEVKAQVMQEAQDKAENMEAYVMISFEDYKTKAAFMERFGFDAREKFLKGEVFENMIERVE